MGDAAAELYTNRCTQTAAEAHNGLGALAVVMFVVGPTGNVHISWAGDEPAIKHVVKDMGNLRDEMANNLKMTD